MSALEPNRAGKRGCERGCWGESFNVEHRAGNFLSHPNRCGRVDRGGKGNWPCVYAVEQRCKVVAGRAEVGGLRFACGGGGGSSGIMPLEAGSRDGPQTRYVGILLARLGYISYSGLHKRI